MTVQTRVIWSLPLSEETFNQVSAKGAELYAQGKETTAPTVVDDPTLSQRTVDRTWIDEATALYWISFVEPFNPVSASIIN